VWCAYNSLVLMTVLMLLKVEMLVKISW